MGVQQFLAKVLEPNSAGREIDLRSYSEILVADDNCNDSRGNAPRRRPAAVLQKRRLRMAVDVSAWIHRACQGFGDLLADERHLDNYGRAQLWKEQQQQEQQQELREGQYETEGNQITTNKKMKRSKVTLEQLLKFTRSCTDFVLHRLEKLRQVGEVLVVLDGIAPPIKKWEIERRRQKRQLAQQERDAPAVFSTNQINNAAVADANLERRLKAFRRAGAGDSYTHVLDALIVALRAAQIPFLVAPYEADGQLAYLSSSSSLSRIDLIVTEDSDLIACGCQCPILYKLMMNNTTTHANKSVTVTAAQQQQQAAAESNHDNYSRTATAAAVAVTTTTTTTSTTMIEDWDTTFYRGQLVRHEDLSATRDLDLLDFSPAMLATLFVAAGSDYCPSLPGIGIKTANVIVRQAFAQYFESQKQKQQNQQQQQPSSQEQSQSSSPVPPLQYVLHRLYQETRDKVSLTAAFKNDFERNFLAAVAMFRHAVVFDPFVGQCVIRNFHCPDPELVLYPPYAAVVHSKAALEAVVGTVPPPVVACHVAEGWIHLQTQQLRGMSLMTSNDNENEENGTAIAAQLQLPPILKQFLTARTTARAHTQQQGPDPPTAPAVDIDDGDEHVAHDERLDTQQEDLPQAPMVVDDDQNCDQQDEESPESVLLDTQPPAIKNLLEQQPRRAEHATTRDGPDPPTTRYNDEASNALSEEEHMLTTQSPSLLATQPQQEDDEDNNSNNDTARPGEGGLSWSPGHTQTPQHDVANGATANRCRTGTPTTAKRKRPSPLCDGNDEEDALLETQELDDTPETMVLNNYVA
ncbi:hypothetical protein ACA910_020970 [Epithemia clementina (nom. ined.)]